MAIDPPLSVAALLRQLSDSLSARFDRVVVEGEITGFSCASSGHCYFSLKDADGAPALVRMALFRRTAAALGFAPRDGQRVRVRGRVALYEPRGELQFVAEALELAGAGLLYEQFLRLRAALAAEGWFDPARKRALPAYPRCVAVVTSLGAAALRDVCTTLARRAPQVRVVVVPSRVQGEGAAAELRAALARADAWPEAEAIVLVRGGGALEDLWSFNDPDLVRAVASTRLPVVCGVGHETDVTLCDWAADVRAATPTAAAEVVAPSRQHCLAALAHGQHRLREGVARRLDQHGQRLDRLALRLARPAQALGRQRQALDALQFRLQRVGGQRPRAARETLARLGRQLAERVHASLQTQGHRLDRWQAQLEALSPHQVLARGFAWLEGPEGHALTSLRHLQVGQPVRARLHDGTADLQVQSLQAPAQPGIGKLPRISD